MKSKLLSFVVVTLLLSLLIPFTLAIRVYANEGGTVSEADSMENEAEKIKSLVFDISAVVFSITGLVLSIISLCRSRSDTVRVYYEEIEKPDYYNARHIIYVYRKAKIKLNLGHYEDESFDDFWKRLLEKDPDMAANMWEDIEKYALISGKISDFATYDIVLENVKQAAAIMSNFYQKWGILWHKNYLPTWVFRSSTGFNLIKMYLAVEDFVEEQRRENPYYAAEFQNLCQNIYRICKKKIRECRDIEKKNLGYQNGKRDALEWDYEEKGGMKQSARPVAKKSKNPKAAARA